MQKIIVSPIKGGAILFTIKVVANLVKKLEGLKVRKLEGSKVERVSGYGPHPPQSPSPPPVAGSSTLIPLPQGERE